MKIRHEYNDNGFCKYCGWEREFIEKTGRACTGPTQDQQKAEPEQTKRVEPSKTPTPKQYQKLWHDVIAVTLLGLIPVSWVLILYRERSSIDPNNLPAHVVLGSCGIGLTSTFGLLWLHTRGTLDRLIAHFKTLQLLAALFQIVFYLFFSAISLWFIAFMLRSCQAH